MYLIENGAFIQPRATLAGSVQVGEDTMVGVGATVLDGKKIGKNVTDVSNLQEARKRELSNLIPLTGKFDSADYKYRSQVKISADNAKQFIRRKHEKIPKIESFNSLMN